MRKQPVIPYEEAKDAYHWAYEVKKCSRDLAYLAENYLHVKSKNVIGFPPLRYNPVQRFLLDKMKAQLKRTGKIRQIWGKCRQVGASTLALSLVFQQTAFRNHRNAFIVSYDEPTSYERFDTIYTFYDALPPPLQAPTRYRAKAKIEFEGRKSRILANHARNTNVGAGEMNHILHLTEAARYPNPDELMSSLWPTISDAAGDDFSVVIIESTSFFGGDWFKEFAEAAMKGENEFEFSFIPWHMHHLYNTTPPPGFVPNAEERDLMRRHHLTLANIAWRRRTMSQYKANPLLFYQEFPLTWEESWILPKGTMRVFTYEMLEHTDQTIRPGRPHIVTNRGLEESLSGGLEVWALPEDGRPYDIGIDVAQGRQYEDDGREKGDWTVIEVIDRQTLEQVAEARGRWNTASEEFLNFVYWIAKIYNTGQVIIDITGGWGHTLLQDLQRRDYPNLWQWRRRDDIKERASSRIGFVYTHRDKALLVMNAAGLVEREKPIIHSRVLVDELAHYLNINLDEWGGAPGWYDDAANAYMLALLAASDERRYIQPPQPPAAAPTVKPKWAYHDIDADLRPPVPAYSPSIMKPWN